MQYLTIEEAAQRLPGLIQILMAGEEIWITQNSRPIAKIVSLEEKKKTSTKRIKAGSAKGLIRMSEDFDEPLADFREYMV